MKSAMLFGRSLPMTNQMSIGEKQLQKPKVQRELDGRFSLSCWLLGLFWYCMLDGAAGCWYIGCCAMIDEMFGGTGRKSSRYLALKEGKRLNECQAISGQVQRTRVPDIYVFTQCRRGPQPTPLERLMSAQD